jgi:hypothetical protein
MPCLVGLSSVENLIEAALSFGQVPSSLRRPETHGLLCLVRNADRSRVSPSKRLLLNPITLHQIPDVWEQADYIDGERYWFRPSLAIAVMWMSCTKSRLLAIPLPNGIYLSIC